MKRSKSLRIAFVLMLVLSSRAIVAQEPPPANRQGTAAVNREEKHRLEAWRKSMARTPLPKKGCFKASYPKSAWEEVACTTPPERPYPPGHPRPQTVGNGIDFSAVVAGHISTAVGSFDSTNGVASENDSGSPNTFSLQLNSEFFVSPTCSGSSNPAVCKGWEQFVYSTSSANAFIQYWLINYAAACPGGWFTYGPHCYRNSVNATGAVPGQPITNLGQISLTGTVTGGVGGTDTLIIGYPPGMTLNAVNQDSVLGLAGAWQTAEFGIYGDGNGGDATFNPGATMAVRTSVDDGSMSAPNCVLEGFTGETNSLTQVPPCCPYGGASPAIVFWLSSNPGATSSCAGGTSIGDTHLTNINGLFYDFQATGDFLLAETNPGFIVHTRQKSGAPNWPNAAVNKAVAMKLGKTRAAVCLDPTRLILDGKPRDLADTKWLTLPSGVEVARSGNVYLFTRPSGESVRAEVNSGYINVSVDLGHLPQATVYGLLGNANGNMTEDDLATRNRVVLRQPVSFADLYHPYADSWRVAPSESLVSSLCGDRGVERGSPDKPFYASDLPRDQYQRARVICTEAGVKGEALLDACILDTTVLGTKAAAQVFARTLPPRAEVRVGYERREP